MDCEKRIAYIFEEAKIFLTKDGRYYRYAENGGHVKCRRLTGEEQKAFLSRFEMSQRHQKEETVDWHPVAAEKKKNENLPNGDSFRSDKCIDGGRRMFMSYGRGVD